MELSNLKSLRQICDPNAKPSIVRETASTALIEGNNSLGAVVGNFAMGVAIEKAKTTGVGWVTVRGSNHFGIAGHYSAQALSQNMLGMAFTNGRSTVDTMIRNSTNNIQNEKYRCLAKNHYQYT